MGGGDAVGFDEVYEELVMSALVGGMRFAAFLHADFVWGRWAPVQGVVRDDLNVVRGMRIGAWRCTVCDAICSQRTVVVLLAHGTV